MIELSRCWVGACAASALPALVAVGLSCSSDESEPIATTSTAGAGGGGMGGSAGQGGTGGTGGAAGGAPQSMGPLTIHPANARYFARPDGQPVFMASTYGGNTLQDQGDVGTFDWSGYLSLLEQHDLNLAKYVIRDRCRNNGAITPTLYARTGPGTAVDGLPKFDLDQINPAYVAQLQARTAELESRGIYVVVMFFNRFDVVAGANSWDASAFNGDNNINGIDGDTNGDGEGKEVQTLPLPSEVEAVERARVRAIIDAVNPYDNVIYEVCNETYGDSAWQEWVTAEIRDYQAGLPKQHLVGQTATWPSGANADLLDSTADWISPERDNGGNGDYEDDPPAQDGSKIVIVDSDHVTAGEKCTPTQVWAYFTTGAHPMCYEGWDISREATHDAMRDARGYARRVSLSTALPAGTASSTGYALVDPGAEYLVFQPDTGTFSVDVAAGDYDYEWFEVGTSTVQDQGTVTAPGGSTEFEPPFAGQAVLYLVASSP
ncbi:MAG: hypothetical protein JRI23_00120 [Deltaproteobacteria bacterium]|jgi:hypothetical protein|nr:hypothetical protein [Deltaproteobacteria bacterium]MBW2529848.1 hypothetical protein [Deltaproteobacteria bacterium]